MYSEHTASPIPFRGRRARRLILLIILLSLLPMRSTVSIAAGRWSDATPLPATGNPPRAPFVAPRDAAWLPRAVPAGVANAPDGHRAAAGLPPFPPIPALSPHPGTSPTMGMPAPLHGATLLRRTAGPGANLQIQRGWNLISLPLAPTTPLSATTLLTALLTATSGHLAALYALTDNAWAPSVLDVGGHLSGSDFLLQVGTGYLLYADAAGTLPLSGTVPAAPTWSLAAGWNLVGLPQGATSAISATAVLAALVGSTGGHLAALYALTNSAWAPSVLDVGGHLSPTDFTLNAGAGYLLYSDAAARAFAVPGFLPPDPTTVAPPIDTTVATTVYTSTQFIYSGPDPIQTGVAPGTIAITRAAVLRGKVLTTTGQPLPGVTIAILNHPEYGQTLSRADGMFDMAVNGGDPLTVTYTKAGYLPLQRHAQPPWQDYLWLPDVAMIPYDSHVTVITLPGNGGMQVARGSVETDSSGTRQATVLFPPGTTATMTLPNGTAQPLTTLHVRATEVTVGASGPRAMPGELPPTSGYTYATDFSVDEATATGAISVTFSRPVYEYVENFLGFPTGMIVPSGYYDRAQGRWVASRNGLVIKILSITGGLAILDVDGSGNPASAAQLQALGLTVAEQQELAVLYRAGQSLWRVPLAHFSFFDGNDGTGCLPDPQGEPACVPPNLPNPDMPLCTCQQQQDDNAKGSTIGLQTQTLGEDVGVTGTPFLLHYAGDRVAGSAAARTLQIPLSGATTPYSLNGITLQVDVAGQDLQQSFPVAPNQRYTFTWDGKDAYGREVQGRSR